MGNETSNIRVRLDERDGEFQDIGKHKLSRSNRIYNNKYLEVTHKITYFDGKFKFDLYIEERQGDQPFFVYYNPSKLHRVTEVKSYFLESNQNRPLLLSFTTSGEHFTYRYYDLVWAKETTTIRVEHIDNIDKSEFDEELEEQANAILKEIELAGTPYVSDYTSIYLGMNPDKPTRYVVNVGSGVLCVIVAQWAKCDFCKNVRILKFKVRHYGDKLYSVWDNAWYKWSDTKYYVYFYTGTGYNNRGQHIFTFYPRNHRYVIVNVEAFFATMDPNLPFCIGFKLRRGENIYTRYDEFVSKGTAYNYEFASIFAEQIKERVEHSFHEYFKKFKFEVAQYLDTQMVIIPPDDEPEHRKTIGKDKIYKKVGFRGVNTYPVLIRQLFDCGLFTINSGEDYCRNRNSIQHVSESPITNRRIQKETLKNVDKKDFYGVVVYYTNEEIKVDKAFPKVKQGREYDIELTDKYPVPNNVALLIDFVSDCDTRIQFVRQDVEGTEWKEETVDYSLDSDLVDKLNEIIHKIRLSTAREDFVYDLEEIKEDEFKIKKPESYEDDGYDSEEEDDDDDDDEEEEEEGEEEVIEERGLGLSESSHEITVPSRGIITEGVGAPDQPHGKQPGHEADGERRFGASITATVTEQGTGATRVVTTSPSYTTIPASKPEDSRPVATKTDSARPVSAAKPIAAKPASAKPASAKPAPARPPTTIQSGAPRPGTTRSGGASQATASSRRTTSSTSRSSTSRRGPSGPQGPRGDRGGKEKTKKKKEKKKEQSPPKPVPPPAPPPPLPQTPQFQAQRQDSAHVEQVESSGASPGTIAGASVGSIVGTAAISGGVTVAMRPELIITSIKALI